MKKYLLIKIIGVVLIVALFMLAEFVWQRHGQVANCQGAEFDNSVLGTHYAKKYGFPFTDEEEVANNVCHDLNDPLLYSPHIDKYAMLANYAAWSALLIIFLRFAPMKGTKKHG
jgi:hypothetical protein